MGMFDYRPAPLRDDEETPAPPDTDAMSAVLAKISQHLGTPQRQTTTLPPLVHPDPQAIQDALSRAHTLGIVKTALGSTPSWNQARLGHSPMIKNDTSGLDAMQQQALAPIATQQHYADAQNKQNLEQAKLTQGDEKIGNAYESGQTRGLITGLTSQQRLAQGNTRIEQKDRSLDQTDERIKIARATLAQQNPTLSPEAIDMAATQYVKTGVLPNFGYGKSGAVTRATIANKAAQTSPGVDLAANKANYGADTGSLKALQKTADAVDAYEKTAGKNLDQFLAQSKGIVDTGSPLLNLPAREFQKRVAGDPAMTGFETSRQVALSEIAKVVTNPALTGVLSDSARHEVSQLIGPDATLGQIFKAATILKQDMANRKQSTHEQIAAVQGRISGKPVQSDTVTVRRKRDGKTQSLPRDQAQRFLADPGFEEVK